MDIPRTDALVNWNTNIVAIADSKVPDNDKKNAVENKPVLNTPTSNTLSSPKAKKSRFPQNARTRSPTALASPSFTPGNINGIGIKLSMKWTMTEIASNTANLTNFLIRFACIIITYPNQSQDLHILQ